MSILDHGHKRFIETILMFCLRQNSKANNIVLEIWYTLTATSVPAFHVPLVQGKYISQMTIKNLSISKVPLLQDSQQSCACLKYLSLHMLLSWVAQAFVQIHYMNLDACTELIAQFPTNFDLQDPYSPLPISYCRTVYVIPIWGQGQDQQNVAESKSM